ncbi:cupin domain-containing protein [Sulfuricurvum sp.]|uniref:cupin domain-containing protein n=1 Tax=Sulfuricurvum sp. TaxID=2025608 RepID=UPI00262F583E|nr:cupin domain-containing protein [Sulfuricurvum sp.]MDD2780330.1 cupin domain-containing protein [Sulfuricurvum sp.]
MITLNNLYRTETPVSNSEIFTPLFQNKTLKIESIRSWLKAPGEIYDQQEDEWVVLLIGEASLEVNEQRLTLSAGDYCFIPAHTKHQVLSTSSDALWLGVFSS